MKPCSVYALSAAVLLSVCTVAAFAESKPIHAGADAQLTPPAVLANLTNPGATGNLMQAKDGNFYGVTSNGSGGTLYMVTPAGGYSVVADFAPDVPVGGVVQGKDGNLYGLVNLDTASGPGPASLVGLYAYNIARKSMFYGPTIVAYGDSGRSLATDLSGNLYFFSTYGGPIGAGAIYKVTLNSNADNSYPPPPPTVTDIYDFDTPIDPVGTPLIASDDYLYGLGAYTSEQNSSLFRFNLAAPQDGATILASDYLEQATLGDLAEAANGDIYFAATDYSDYADLFQAKGGGQYGVSNEDYYYGSGELHISLGGPLLLASGKAIIAGYGSSYQQGTISEVNVNDSPASGFTDLYDFPGGNGGSQPVSVPFVGNVDGNGVLVGTTRSGGTSGDGIIYAFNNFSSPLLSLTTSTAAPETNSPITLNWSSANAFSNSAKTCYANSSDYTFSGQVSASGSVTVTPAHPANKQYSITCGGVESAVLNLPVTNGIIEFYNDNDSGLSPNFGVVGSGSTYANVSNTLSNDSKTPFPVSLSISGKYASRFSIYSNNCPATLPPSQSCNIVFAYTAPQVKEAEIDQVTVALARDSFSFNPSSTETLTATAAPAGQLTLSSVSHNFGAVTVGTPYSYTFQVYNGTGKSQTYAQSVSSSSGTASSTTTCPSTLGYHEACTVTVTFTPGVSGPFQIEDLSTSSATIGPYSTVTLMGTAQ